MITYWKSNKKGQTTKYITNSQEILNYNIHKNLVNFARENSHRKCTIGSSQFNGNFLRSFMEVYQMNFHGKYAASLRDQVMLPIGFLLTWEDY